jgi:predicted sulfurtransferase
MLAPSRARRPAAPQLAALPLLWRQQWHSGAASGLRVSARQQRRYHDCAQSATINFYRFRAPACLISEDDLMAQSAAVKELCSARGVLGTVILATEGVNGSLAGELETVREVVEHVSSTPLDQWPDAAPNLVMNEEIFATPREAPFGKLKVKVKPEIVTMRADKPLDMNCRCVTCTQLSQPAAGWLVAD